MTVQYEQNHFTTTYFSKVGNSSSFSLEAKLSQHYF